ncbi:MAG: nitrous oxide-stimulated promoter family protein [Lentisphaerae bacterium]|nr:nitrous oxide-stimulated promoter family protein [Lentisphaerota bacterium]
MGRQQERRTLRAMIRLYCKQQHQSVSLCEACLELLTYAEARVAHCPFGDEKPVCRSCEIHCYTPKMRERITAVMRYAGPRMMAHHPILGVLHLLKARRGRRGTLRASAEGVGRDKRGESS